MGVWRSRLPLLGDLLTSEVADRELLSRHGLRPIGGGAAGHVQVAPDATGKDVDADSLTSSEGGAPTVYRQNVVIADPTTYANKAAVTAAGAQKVDGSAVTQPVSSAQSAAVTAAWTSATGLNTALSLTVTNYNYATVSLNATSTITGGVIIFEASDDAGTTWYQLALNRIDATGAAETTFTLAVTSHIWRVNVSALTTLRVRLNPQITGTGTVNLRAQAVVTGSDTPAVYIPGNSDANVLAPPVIALSQVWYGNNGTWGRARQIENALDANSTGIPVQGLAAQLDDTAPSTVTENQWGPLRMSAKRGLHAQIRDAAGNDRGANVDAGGNLQVQNATNSTASSPTYSASKAAGVGVASATDVATLAGSGTKTIYVTRIIFLATIATAQALGTVNIIKRSAADTGGTSTTTTAVPHDANSAAATGSCLFYTANPSVGTVIANVRTYRYNFQVTAATVTPATLDIAFDNPITLRGTAHQLAVGLSGQGANATTIDVTFEWFEA